MDIIEQSQKMRELILRARERKATVALVPTMGFLHKGHLSLVQEAHKRADLVIVSIFLNPTQFNDPSDYEKYPRDLAQDLALLKEDGVDTVFCPPVSEIYRPDAETWTSVDKLSGIHEGEFRPGHFRGVTTVVNILFNIVQPQVALFGEKDFQQLALIRKMVHDLHLPLEIVGCPTIRESDGLAMSSRNARLSERGRQRSTDIYRGLSAAQNSFKKGERSASKLVHEVQQALRDCDFVQVEYARLIDSQTFQERREAREGDRIIVAAFVDSVRLIDNIALEGGE